MALVNENGTLLAKEPGSDVIEEIEEDDPYVEVKVAVYEDTVYAGVDPDRARQRTLKYRAGQRVRQSEWDANFPAPTISTVSPATGPAAGGTTITITGTGFTMGTAVTVGGAAATAENLSSDTKLTCVTPSGTAGARDVVVTTAGGSATKTGGFTYA